MGRHQFTDNEIALAKETSLTELAAYYGYHPIRCGNQLYTLQEHDSIRIYDDRTWYRWSRAGNGKESGGSQIDFLLQFCGVESVPEAVCMLLEFQGICPENGTWEENAENCLPRRHQATQINEKKPTAFVLPEAVKGNYRYAYAYLMQTRGLSQKVIDYFVKDLKILYEEKEHHNLVFLGKDTKGAVRYATKRGTADIYGTKYRGDVAGNDKNYGINIVNRQSNELKVFEANIDLMSYLDIKDDYWSNKLVLGMTADNPLVRFLEEHPYIKRICFCLDNDEAGMLAMFGKKAGKAGEKDRPGLLEKYAAQGYQTYTDIVPKSTGCKDWNEFLIYEKTRNLEKTCSKNKRTR